jgi:hypothetical protein
MQIIEDLHLGVTHALFTVVRDRIHKATATAAESSHGEMTSFLQAR